LVLEIAADLPGDIRRICSWIKFDIAVYTKIVPAHLEFFKTTKGVFNEKKQLAKSLSPEAILILNKKDPWSANIAKESAAKVYYYDNDEIDLNIKAASMLAEIIGINSQKIKESLKKYKPLPGRLNKININGIEIIDDTYNANPSSVSLALNIIKGIKAKRKIVILGSMFELGDYQEKAHKTISKKAKDISDILILVGENYYGEKDGADYWFLDSQEFIDKNSLAFIPGDLILVKGSRSMKMEKIIIYLKNKINPSTSPVRRQAGSR
jgi:UDP-N-acetylmuramoyl-tripeptide--D-alanyl-D-alanine ligase